MLLMKNCWVQPHKNKCECMPFPCWQRDPSKGMYATKADCLNACSKKKYITCYSCNSGCIPQTFQTEKCSDLGLFTTKEECDNSKECAYNKGCYLIRDKNPCKCEPSPCYRWNPKQGFFKTEEQCMNACRGGGKAINCYECDNGECSEVSVYAKTCKDAGKYSTKEECSNDCSYVPPTPPPKPPSGKGEKTIWIIVGVSIAVLILLIVTGAIAYFVWKKNI